MIARARGLGRGEGRGGVCGLQSPTSSATADHHIGLDPSIRNSEWRPAFRPIAPSDRVEVVFVQPQPSSGPERVVDFALLAGWMERRHAEVPFAMALATALRGWSGD